MSSLDFQSAMVTRLLCVSSALVPHLSHCGFVGLQMIPLPVMVYLFSTDIQGVCGKFCDNTAKTVKKRQNIQISNIYSKLSLDTQIYSLGRSSSYFMAHVKSKIGNAFNFTVTDFKMTSIKA